jgi:hypothetical protein
MMMAWFLDLSVCRIEKVHIYDVYVSWLLLALDNHSSELNVACGYTLVLFTLFLFTVYYIEFVQRYENCRK